MDRSRNHMSAVTQRQMTSVGDTEESEAEKEEREAADVKELLPWAKGFIMHLENYTDAAADEYTKCHLSAAFTDFGKELEVPYSKMDKWEKAYLLAKSRDQTKTAAEIFEYIKVRRTAASVSSLPKLGDLVLTLTLRQKSSQRCRQIQHLVPQKRPLPSRHPTSPRHHTPTRDQNWKGHLGERQGKTADRGSIQLSATTHSIPNNFSSHNYLTFTLIQYVYNQLTARQLYWGTLHYPWADT
jgi:hypothetical protein